MHTHLDIGTFGLLFGIEELKRRLRHRTADGERFAGGDRRGQSRDVGIGGDENPASTDITRAAPSNAPFGEQILFIVRRILQKAAA
jgi:hypothetical protein